MRAVIKNRPHVQLQKELHIIAKNLRKSQTSAEKELWYYLKGKRYFEVRFRRQYPIDRFIVDFCCVKQKLVIEVDGEIHNMQKNRDNNRDIRLNQFGFFVIRFTNQEVKEDIEAVLKKIRYQINKPSPL